MAFALVLTAAPGRGLATSDLDAAARALGEAGAARRLGPDAAEIPCPAPPAAPPELPGVDVNLLPAAGREKRVLVADMDSTIIGCECIDELAALAGIEAEVAAITERAMAGELDFDSALRARVRLLEGLPEAAVERVWTERIRLNPGARILVRTMAARGARTVLVSGGFDVFTARVAEAAGFAAHRANRLIVEDGHLTGWVAEPVLGREAKRAALEAETAALGLGPEAALALGDGANDLEMVRAAGLGVGWRPKPALAAEAGAVIAHADMTAVLHLQGLHADVFLRD